MPNNRKDMSYYILWIQKDEEEIVKNILKKDIKTNEDLTLLGEIICRINAKEDLKLG